VDDKPKQCNALLIGLGAAAACAIVSKDAGWAAACAALAVASCTAFNNYQVKQAKTAQQVGEEFVKDKGALPEEATLVDYKASFAPTTVVARGQKVDASVEMSVVPSRNGGPVLIEEEWSMYDAKGEKWLGPVRKTVNAASKEAGSYVGGFSLNLPKELPQGNYEFRSRVYLNGAEVRSNVNPIQVAASWERDGAQVVVARR